VNDKDKDLVVGLMTTHLIVASLEDLPYDRGQLMAIALAEGIWLGLSRPQTAEMIASSIEDAMARNGRADREAILEIVDAAVERFRAAVGIFPDATTA
jgi:hypothetical protein